MASHSPPFFFPHRPTFHVKTGDSLALAALQERIRQLEQTPGVTLNGLLESVRDDESIDWNAIRAKVMTDTDSESWAQILAHWKFHVVKGLCSGRYSIGGDRTRSAAYQAKMKVKPNDTE